MCSQNEYMNEIQTKPEAATGGTKLAANNEAAFIDQAELLRRLPVARRTLFNLRKDGRIPFVRLGGRRICFHWPSVEAALVRQERGGNL